MTQTLNRFRSAALATTTAALLALSSFANAQTPQPTLEKNSLRLCSSPDAPAGSTFVVSPVNGHQDNMVIGLKPGSGPDGKSACIALMSPSQMAPVYGPLYLSPDGVWTGKLGGEAVAVGVKLDDGSIEPIEITDSQTGFFSSTSVRISGDLADRISGASEDDYLYFYFKRKMDQSWRPFEIDVLRHPARVKIGHIRKAMNWSEK